MPIRVPCIPKHSLSQVPSWGTRESLTPSETSTQTWGGASPSEGLLLESRGECPGSNQLFKSTTQRAPSGAAQSQAASLHGQRQVRDTQPRCPEHHLLGTSSSLAAKGTHA